MTGTAMAPAPNRWLAALAMTLGTFAVFGAVYLAAYAVARPLHRNVAAWVAPVVAVAFTPRLTRLFPRSLTDRDRTLLRVGTVVGALLGVLVAVLIGVLLVDQADLWSTWGGTVAAVCIVGTSVATAYLVVGEGPAFREEGASR
jgi:hypothetical protein